MSLVQGERCALGRGFKERVSQLKARLQARQLWPRKGVCVRVCERERVCVCVCVRVGGSLTNSYTLISALLLPAASE